jgi:hypothetical protein
VGGIHWVGCRAFWTLRRREILLPLRGFEPQILGHPASKRKRHKYKKGKGEEDSRKQGMEGEKEKLE